MKKPKRCSTHTQKTDASSRWRPHIKRADGEFRLIFQSRSNSVAIYKRQDQSDALVELLVLEMPSDESATLGEGARLVFHLQPKGAQGTK